MVVLEHETGEVEVLKTPSTPHDPGQATLDGLAELIAGGLRAEEVASFTHGTTVGTNILVQDKGARVGLLITDGFSGVNDVWHIPRFGSDLSDIYVEKNPPVEPWLREEVVERIDFQGNVKKPLDVDQAREAVKRLKRKGAESIAGGAPLLLPQPDSRTSAGGDARRGVSRMVPSPSRRRSFHRYASSHV